MTYNQGVYEAKWCGSGNTPQNPDPSYQWYYHGSCTSTVNSAPTVSLTTPSCNSSFLANTSIAFTATASDTDGSVQKVEFFDGTIKLGEDLTAPYTFTWSNPTVGSHLIYIKATDNLGAYNLTEGCYITINLLTGDCSNLSRWSKALRYNVGVKVNYNQKAYECIAYSKGNTPSNSPSKWKYLYDCISTTATNTYTDLTLRAYPNPSEEEFVVDLQDFTSKHDIKVFDSNGRCVYKKDAVSAEEIIFGKEFGKGIYFLHLDSYEDKTIIRLVKK